ncbi:hypothetical protein B0H14DRAFT_2615507 [Mycena olivaceomarginata]|nr:hypothetical protein B0H14DRAFT_2615507 [Mycena olivaceomarginata]
MGEVSPAFINTRKIRQRIAAYQKTECPHGKGFQGVLHHVETHKKPLPIKERVLSVVIDYTFKRVEGDMDEWVVSGFSDRFNRRITFARLYCNRKSAAAFHQLFYELFDSIHRVTGQKLKLHPFFPNANSRIIMLDGEVSQALGLGSFLVTYNQAAISKIHTTDPIELRSYMLKTCTVHFQRDLIADTLTSSPNPIFRKTSSHILNQSSGWPRRFCASQTDPKVQQWYLQKQRNPWYLPSVNQYLSKILLDDWKITPRTTNIAGTSHAATNADTSTQLPLLPAILVSERDKDDVEEIHQIVRDGIMRKHWNGPSERE